MIKNERISKIYERHTRHLKKDAKSLGDAESLEEILTLADEMNPNVYMLSRCCVDGNPTIQLATWDRVKRVRLTNLSNQDRTNLVKTLEERGIAYKETKYLSLKPDFTETDRCKFQMRFGFVIKPYYEIKVLYHYLKDKIFDALSINDNKTNVEKSVSRS